jgi:hypothetical protein
VGHSLCDDTMAEGDLKSVHVDFTMKYDCSHGILGKVDRGTLGTVDLMHNGMLHQKTGQYGLSPHALPDSLNNGIMFR